MPPPTRPRDVLPLLGACLCVALFFLTTTGRLPLPDLPDLPNLPRRGDAAAERVRNAGAEPPPDACYYYYFFAGDGASDPIEATVEASWRADCLGE